MMAHRKSITVSASLLTLALSVGIVVAQNASSAQKTITGTVVTVDDKPAQTHVQLFNERAKHVGGPTPLPPGGSKTGDAVVGAPAPMPLQKPAEKPWKETDTDAAGKFSFTGIEPGRYVVVAGTGRNVTKMNVEVKANEDVKPLTLKLPSK